MMQRVAASGYMRHVASVCGMTRPRLHCTANMHAVMRTISTAARWPSSVARSHHRRARTWTSSQPLRGFAVPANPLGPCVRVVVREDVREALDAGQPVVALESTIISHGLSDHIPPGGAPLPTRATTAFRVAREVEQEVAASGAVPATIAVLNGVVHVGLTEEQLEMFVEERELAQKVSVRDLAHVLTSHVTHPRTRAMVRPHGSTTVAATMLIAESVGIPVFVTGGIGGVHRGGHVSMDVSADVCTLSHTRTAVVCAGVKSILDIPRTLEVLETYGVPVITYGSSEFPAFFSPRSGVPSPLHTHTLTHIAAAVATHRTMGAKSGMLIAVPNPEPAQGEAVEAAIQQALAEMEQAGVHGRDVTPYVLKRVSELTGGASQASNIALIKSNARVGGHLCVFATAYMRDAEAAAAVAAEAIGAASGVDVHTEAVMHAGQLRAAAADGSLGALSSFLSGLGNGTGVSLGSTSPGIAHDSQHAASTGPALSAHALTRTRQKDVDSHEHVTESRKEGWPASGAPKRRARGFHTCSRCASAASTQPLPALGRPVVFGGAVVDVISKPMPGCVLVAGQPFVAASSNPGQVAQSFGGVGRNIAEVMARLGCPPTLVSAVGMDPHGAALVQYLLQSLQVSLLSPPSTSPSAVRTAVYNAMLDNKGELVAAIADMVAFDTLTSANLESGLASPGETVTAQPVRASQLVSAAPFVVIDGNVPAATTRHLCEAAARASPSVPVLFEATSVAKCVRVVDGDSLHLVTVLKPNRLEAVALATAIRQRLGLKQAPPGPEDDTNDAPDDSSNTETVALDSESASSFSEVAAELGIQTAPASDEAGDSDGTDYQVLTAAQTVLSALIRPGGLRDAVHPDTIAYADRYLETLRRGDKPRPFMPAEQAASGCGATIEQRKHVIVTLGSDGVLWLSAPPARNRHLADLMAVLPFFVAAQHSELGMDFTLVPAPAARVVKVTGAGDTLTGAIVAALVQRRSFAQAIRRGVAAAKVAVESPAGESTISQRLSDASVDVAMHDVAPVDEGYTP